MSSEVMVSVYCLTYNHEKYIRDALEGFVKQRTNFKYEVFVHDDASTDHTAEIIAEYAAKYPDIIKPIYQKENQYSKGKGITKKFIYPKLTGKYFATCEGDDYWCDENKLQRQFDFLETHPDYSACVHNTLEKDCRTGKEWPRYDTEADHDLTFEEVIKCGGATFHTSSMFYRREFFEVPDELRSTHFSDYPRAVYFRLSGKIYRFKEIMSVYRYLSEGSWTERNLGEGTQEQLLRTQTWAAEFTAKVARYCQETGKSPEIQAAANDVANRDRIQREVLRRGVGCLLADQRKDFMRLTREKKGWVLDTAREQLKWQFRRRLKNGKK